jgi:coenzyme F420 hydrogenase subunit beta
MSLAFLHDSGQSRKNEEIHDYLEKEVIGRNNCVGCGMCVSLLGGVMVKNESGVFPVFSPNSQQANLDKIVRLACPGHGIHYPSLYRKYYGKLPDSWLLGEIIKVRTGYASDEPVRRNGASGGVITATLCYLLESGYIDAAIVVQQGIPSPEEASVVIAQSRDEILASAQSVYVPTSTLDILSKLEPETKYAITCLPEQAASLRVLQCLGYEPAKQIKYVLGPYTGTALEPAAIRCLLRSHGIVNEDKITSLKWRAGEWPGYLEVKLASGRVIRSKKVYYNFLIPFFVTRSSLHSIDFSNEFSDLSVGDAWSPKFEKIGAGFSVVITRSNEMESVLCEMISNNYLVMEDIGQSSASEMHGHMLDFKKRGGFIRNKWRQLLGFKSPDYGIVPNKIPLSRYFMESIISGLFVACHNSFSRKLLEFVPEAIIGPLFNKLRLLWKSASMPTKRKGLGKIDFIESDNGRSF